MTLAFADGVILCPELIETVAVGLDNGDTVALVVPYTVSDEFIEGDAVLD